MLVRGAGLAVVTLALVGCAGDNIPAVGSGFSAAPAAVTGSIAGYVPAGGTASETMQPRTLASTVLAAIALERVTGRKPDPGRLIDAR